MYFLTVVFSNSLTNKQAFSFVVLYTVYIYINNIYVLEVSLFLSFNIDMWPIQLQMIHGEFQSCNLICGNDDVIWYTWSIIDSHMIPQITQALDCKLMLSICISTLKKHMKLHDNLQHHYWFILILWLLPTGNIKCDLLQDQN